ncbi:MAG: hypothetical protein P1U86_07980 [Verrucomicrobiales bacterium]|nr:hypothetical protein [Verrucomicrobiales bacterium]
MRKANWFFWVRVMLLCFVSVTARMHGYAQEMPKGIIPVDVEELFAVLPKQVEGWKLTGSRGWQGQDVWLEASATRTFERAAMSNDDTPVTRKVRITVQDTGKFAGSDIALFDDFSPGEEEGVNRLYMNSIPVIVIEEGPRLYAQFFLQGRFILSVSFSELPKSELGDWFKKLNVRLLAGVKDGPVVGLPKTYTSRSIDELKGRDKSSVIKPVYEIEDEESEEEGKSDE